MNIYSSLETIEREMISFVGGGGKTTSMFSLAKELSKKGKKVITTTTTKIVYPNNKDTKKVLLFENLKELEENIMESLKKNLHITIGSRVVEGNKVKGIPPSFLDIVYEKKIADFILIESDGSKGKPLKAHSFYEPLIPSKATKNIVIIGIDSIGSRLNEQNVHRPKIASALMGIEIDEIINIDSIIKLLNHPKGLLKNTPNGCEAFLIINKIHTEKDKSISSKLALKLMSKTNKYKKIILSNMGFDNPIIKIFKR